MRMKKCKSGSRRNSKTNRCRKSPRRMTPKRKIQSILWKLKTPRRGTPRRGTPRQISNDKKYMITLRNSGRNLYISSRRIKNRPTNKIRIKYTN